MNSTAFWKLIDETLKASNGDLYKQSALLIQELASQSQDYILGFKAIYDHLMDNAYDASLWDAADIIGCGCSEDGFEDFRDWLISQGKEVYEKALADPESLVDRVEIHQQAQSGLLGGVPWEAYEQKTGQEMSGSFRERPELKGSVLSKKEREARFPKLAAKFDDCDKRGAVWAAWPEDEEPYF
ncbi:MAG: DUF4240 domain-containing protein [Anaerolineae bacterium]|jgi:hypothetical protein|nr:DUF4240 domain-containing protein [Anaerolineae bacterium]MBT7189993.1 DUF4240 domain-containing protein [Anaerolineae bacterium]MBT7991079.1 DUF4240 domain-containing protein [Anaerolineae bacterium]